MGGQRPGSLDLPREEPPTEVMPCSPHPPQLKTLELPRPSALSPSECQGPPSLRRCWAPKPQVLLPSAPAHMGLRSRPAQPLFLASLSFPPGCGIFSQTCPSHG